MADESDAFIPGAWEDGRFPPGSGAKSITLVRKFQVERLLQWLTEKYGKTTWTYTAVRSVDPAVQTLVSEAGCWIDVGEPGLKLFVDEHTTGKAVRRFWTSVEVEHLVWAPMAIGCT